MIKRIYRNSALLLIVSTAVCAIMGKYRISAGLLVGGALSLANLKALVWGVTGLMGDQKAAGKLIFFSGLRFMIILMALLVLLKLGLINLIGVVSGMTVVFTLIIFEGLREARELN
ncbi:MAG: ATP synthase subunit I [Nitrospiraceae bacterium]|nr:ATP synthase subunit I [Nitrospiraceae bacterium]